MFNNNRATNDEIAAQINTVQFRKLTGSDGNNAGQGGGIHITLKGTSTENVIAILNCSFNNNSAQFGGGIDAVMQDNSKINNITISGCNFTNNSALERSGGAMNIGYTSGSRVRHNTIRIEGCTLNSNSAGRGGGISFFSSSIKTPSTNRLEFIDCEFVGNSASIGAAVSLRPIAGDSPFDGEPPSPLFQECIFFKNKVTNTAEFLISANDGETQHVVETGVLHTESIEVQLKDFVSFSENFGSAIVATTSQVSILKDTEVHFIKNKAENGGAIALIGFSILKLYSGSHVIFEANAASELGGAVYATSSHQAHFIFSHKCFFSYEEFLHPDNWNTTLNFTNNTAHFGNDIYTDSLLPCAKILFGILTNVTSALQWSPFFYSRGTGNNTIATSPATINFSLPEEVGPGQFIYISSICLDDLGQRIPSAYLVFIDIIEGFASAYPFLSDSGLLRVIGNPGSKFTLTLRTQNTRHVSRSKTGRLGECPLGLTLYNHSVCVCTAQMRGREMYGVLECDMIAFRAFIVRDFWIGCVRDSVATGYCPLGYCHRKTILESQLYYAPKTCAGSDEHSLCVSHRKSRLCGECDEGYTAHFHSDTFICKRCSYGALGLLIYIIAELFPLLLLFAAIVIMKVRMTSGPMQSLILFAQMSTLIHSNQAINNIHHVLVRIHAGIVGVLSLDFLKFDELSFCLWEGATVLDNLLVRYLTTFSAFLLISSYILIIRNNSKFQKCICCKPAKRIIGKMTVFKNAIVHGISTFLILTYTQFTVASFQILSRLKLYGEGGKVVISVVRLQGNVEYFGVDHLPYAIPAVLVLVFLSLPPPLLLISYPLLWKIKARLRPADNERTVWLIRKLLPIIDSFQGVFRDNRRMFAGLLFLWRIVLVAIFALTTNLIDFFTYTQVILLFLFVFHVVAQPYKRRLYNMIDSLLFANMAIINAITWSTFYNTSNVAIGFQVILMYLPLICFAGVGIILLLQKYGLLSKRIKFIENDTSVPEPKNYNQRREKKEENDGDDDLFSRAAEQNHPPLFLNASEAGFELQSKENTLTTDVK